MSTVQAHTSVKCRRHVNVEFRNGIGPDDGLVFALIDTVPIYDGSDVNLAFTTPNTATSIYT
jgi:hypothetical protein